MIVAYHVIWSAYGFWLPNDPRGSWSDFVGAWDLFRASWKATKTTETRSLARDPHDREKRLAAKSQLKHTPVRFNGVQARAVGRGFAEYTEKSGLSVWACAIMPDHVHLVLGRFRLTVENTVIQLKAAATRKLVDEGIHPFQELKPADGPPPKCWAQGEWKAYLDPDDVDLAIGYVERNPLKEGLPRQNWWFATRPVSREARLSWGRSPPDRGPSWPSSRTPRRPRTCPRG